MNTLVLLFYRIGAFFSYFSKSKSERNRIYNESQAHLISSDNYIENQNELKSLNIGNRAVSFSGCGAIALYNILLFLGKITDIKDFFYIISLFEKKGLVFGGRFGISPGSIKKYLSKFSLIIKDTSTSDKNKLDSFGDLSDCFISILFNKGTSLRSGLHYVSITKDDHGNYISHNPNKTGKTLSDALDNASFNKGSHIYTIGIKKKEY